MAKTLAQLQQEAEFWRREARKQLERMDPAGPITDDAVFARMREIGAGPILDAIKRKTGGNNQRRDRVILSAGGGSSDGPKRQGGVGGTPNAVQGGRPNQNQGGFNVQDFFQDFEDAMQAANEAQRERRDQLMEGHNQLMEDVVGAFRDRESQFQEAAEGFGSARAEQINRRFDRLGARAQANLVDRGLTASTVLPPALRGVEEDRSLALNDLGERVQGLLLGQQSQLTGDTANALGQLGGNALRFIEAINETGPDFGQMAQLAQLLGAGNFGQGFGVPTGGGGSTGNQPQDLVGPVQGGTGAVGAPPASSTGIQTIPFGQFFGGGAMQNPLLGMMGQFFGAGQNAIQGNQGIVGGGSSQGPQGPLGFLTGRPLQPRGGIASGGITPRGGGSSMPSLQFPSLGGGGGDAAPRDTFMGEPATRQQAQSFGLPVGTAPQTNRQRAAMGHAQQMLAQGVDPAEVRSQVQGAFATGGGGGFMGVQKPSPGGGAPQAPPAPTRPTGGGFEPKRGVDLRRGRSRPRFNFMPG